MNIADMPTDWWAWNGDTLKPLGVCDDFFEASEKADKLPYPVHWIFSRESLTELRNQANQELEAK